MVSDRDRQVVQELMGIDDLVVAGSHGFDIWSPTEGTIARDAGAGCEELIADVTDRLRAAVGSELQPKIDWDKAGRCRTCSRRSVSTPPTSCRCTWATTSPTRTPSEVLRGRGAGIMVGDVDDPEMAGRDTAAEFVLACTTEVEEFLTTLGR